jgi:hypothetical protein
MCHFLTIYWISLEWYFCQTFLLLFCWTLFHISFLFKPSAFYSYFFLPLAGFLISTLCCLLSLNTRFVVFCNSMLTELFSSDSRPIVFYKRLFPVTTSGSSSWILRDFSCLCYPFIQCIVLSTSIYCILCMMQYT